MLPDLSTAALDENTLEAVLVAIMFPMFPLAMGALVLLIERHYRVRGIHVPGRVVDVTVRYSPNEGSRATPMYSPVITYRTLHGEQMRLPSAYGNVRRRSILEPGQDVHVYYLPKSPTRFRVKEDRTPYALAGFCGGLTLFFLLFSAMILITEL